MKESRLRLMIILILHERDELNDLRAGKYSVQFCHKTCSPLVTTSNIVPCDINKKFATISAPDNKVSHHVFIY